MVMPSICYILLIVSIVIAYILVIIPIDEAIAQAP
jgi:hypothetical protein